MLDINDFLRNDHFRINKRIPAEKLLKYLFLKNPTPLRVKGTGVIDLHNKNQYAFIRFLENSFKSTSADIYVKQALIKKYKLKTNCIVSFNCTIFNNRINSLKLDSILTTAVFYDKTAIYPNEQISLQENNTSKIISFLAPMGFGQRALIVAPPKSGKTSTLMRLLENFINLLNTDKDTEIYVLLCAERSEEATDFQRKNKNISVIYTTFDDSQESQTKTCLLAMEYIKTRALKNKKCIVLIDSLTRVVRAANSTINTNYSKTLSGGIEYQALLFGKKLFGCARNLEGYGSITIIATCLVDTNSRADEVIYEEFKGTSNCDIFLNKTMLESGVRPPIDVKRTSTRNYHLLFENGNDAKLYTEIKNKLYNSASVNSNQDCCLIQVFNKLISIDTKKDLLQLILENTNQLKI